MPATPEQSIACAARYQQMVAAVRSGKTHQWVAREFGVHSNTVRTACRLAGVRGRGSQALGQSVREAIINAVSEGQSISQAAGDLGIGYGVARSVCKGVGIVFRRGMSASTSRARRERWKGIDWTHSNAEIARRIGLNRERVRQMREEMGVSPSPRTGQKAAPDDPPASPGVYRIKNTVTGECYVGGSSNIRRRRRTHFFCLSRGVHPSKSLQASFDEYGPAYFEFQVLELCALEDLPARETEFLRNLPNGVFNTCRNSSGLRRLSPQTA